MLKHRIAAIMAALALAAGVGVAVAFADDSPASTPPAATCPTPPAQAPQGDDEQNAAADVNDAADAVEVEADNAQADDVAGDQQGSNDQSEEADDVCQVED